MNKTRSEVIKDIQQIQNEINQIKSFCDFLGYELTVHKSGRWTNCFIKKEKTISTKFKILGIFKHNNTERIDCQVEIPDKIIAKVNVECLNWIETLEERANELMRNYGTN